MTPTAKVLLKDQLFNRDKVAAIAAELADVQAGFRGDEFVGEVVAKFPDLELKERIGGSPPACSGTCAAATGRRCGPS